MFVDHVGITGTIGSGKGTVAKILAEEGFNSLSYGAVVREELERRGIVETRESLQQLGYDLRRERGEGVWAHRVIDKMTPGFSDVTDGFRYGDQVLVYDRNFPGEYTIDGVLRIRFFLIGVDAHEMFRYERLKRRGREGDPKTYDEFEEQDERDKHGHLNGTGQNVAACMEMVRIRIINDGTIDQLREKVLALDLHP